MNHISDYTNKTVVKILLTVLVSSFSMAHAEGQQSSPGIVFGGRTAEDIAYQKDRDQQQDCNQASQNLRQTNKEIGKVCGDAGLGSECQEKIDDCSTTMGSNTFSTAGQLMSAMGNDYGALVGSLGGKGGSCPQMSGKTYFNRKDSLTKDLEKVKEDLAKIPDDESKITEEYNTTQDKLNEELTKAQEDLDKQKLDMKEKNRKTLESFQNQQNQMKEDLRKKSTDTLALRGQLSQSQQDQALKLIAMTDASGNRACMKAVNDAKKNYDAVATSGSSNYIAQAKKRKQDLIDTYNDCMDAFNQQRNALNKSKKQEQDQINKAITDNEQSINDLTNSLNMAQSQLTEIQNDASTEQDNATQKVTKLMQTNTTKLLAAQQKWQKAETALKAKQDNLNEKLNRLNNEIMLLGPAPQDPDSSKSYKQTGSDLTSLNEDKEQAQSIWDSQNCKQYRTSNSKTGTKSSKGSTRGIGG